MPTTFERPSLISGASNGSGSVSGNIDPMNRGDTADVICGFRPTLVVVEEADGAEFSVTLRIGSVEVCLFSTGICQSAYITLTDNGFQYTQQYKFPTQIRYTAMP